MRNPIRATPNRPVPLPDCILRDGWWLVVPARAVSPTQDRRAFRITEGKLEEGRIDRYCKQDD